MEISKILNELSEKLNMLNAKLDNGDEDLTVLEKEFLSLKTMSSTN